MSDLRVESVIQERPSRTKPCVFIHTNHKQILGAIVSRYSMKRNSARPDAFDVELIEHRNFPFFAEYEGREYLRDGASRVWRNDDLQSFTPLRFMPPELMGYQGRAVVIDPDVFAVGDVWELLSRDMGGKAILCRRSKFKSGAFASSVMLLDCARLSHWQVERDFAAMMAGKRDYHDWISLLLEPPETIGLFEEEWNDFDRLTERTRMLHNTRRRTQPWKTGLPVDYMLADKFHLFPPFALINRARRQLFGDYGLLGRYRRHPDANQERLFFGLLAECLEKGLVTEEVVRREMSANHVRHDALELCSRIAA